LDYIFGDEVTDGNISRNELEALVIIQGTEYKRANSLIGLETKSHDHQSLNNSSSFSSKLPNNVAQSPLSSSSSSPSAICPQHPSPSGSGLSDVEVNLMTGILKLARQSVEDAMIKINDVYMMSSSMRLNHSTLCSVLDSGFSRIPIFKRRDRLCHLGYLLVKELAVVTPGDEVMIETLTLRKPLFVRPSLPLLELLRLFQEGRCHLAMVTLDPALAASSFKNERRQEGRAAILGIVTLEDVLEKVIQKDIRDETDTPYRAAPSLLYHSHISANFSQSHVDLDRAKRERDRERRNSKYNKVSDGLVGLGGSRHSRKGRSAERKVKKQQGKRPKGHRSRGSSRSRDSSAAMSSSSSPTFSFSDSEDESHHTHYNNNLWGGVVKISRGMDEWTKDEVNPIHPAVSSSHLPMSSNDTTDNNAVDIELTTQSNSTTTPKSVNTQIKPQQSHEIHPIQQLLTSEDTDNEENAHLLPKNIAQLCNINKSTPLVVSNNNISKGMVSGYGSTSIICTD